MPRSRTDRSFGFRAPGLIRILIAADPEEVLKAMEALGIQLTDVPSIFDLVLDLFSVFVKPVAVVVNLLERVEKLAAFLERNPFAQIGTAGVPAQAVWADFKKEARNARLQLIKERAKFREDIEKAAEEAPPPGFTFTI